MSMDDHRPGTPDDFTTLGSVNINLPEGISLSSQSGLPPKDSHSPQMYHYSQYTPAKTSMTLSPQPSPDSNRENVMNALKKLQEKIRQLEVERSAAEGNLRTLAHETSRYRDLLTRERSFKPYEPVQSEVSRNTQELQSQLNCAENRCDLLEKQLEYMRKLVQDSEADKQRLMEQQREQKSKIIREETTANIKKQKLSEMEKERMKLNDNQLRAERKIRELEEKLVKEIDNRKKTEEKLTSVSQTDEKRKMKKKSQPRPKTAKVSVSDSRVHYHLNLKEMPFLHSQSTSPSHNVNANAQKVLALMKSHNNVMCEKPGVRRLVLESSGSSSSESDLNELVLQLQDEYAQMGFQHKELNAQLVVEDDEREREDIERELELLTAKMEIKSEQITQLKNHLHSMEKRKAKRKVKCVKKPVPVVPKREPTRERRAGSADRQTVQTSVDRGSRLQILRDMKKLQSSLRPDDLSWDC